MDEHRLSDSELLVMKVIWRREESLSLQDIAERVNRVYEKNWKSQTVSVFLGRIVKKNLLASRHSGKCRFSFDAVG